VADTENEITADLIAELLREQHPDLADLPLTFGARGWDNQLWRLGDDLAVRLPWATQHADELLLKEHALLPAIAPRLPLQIPVPQRLGRPSERFPRPWIVTTWVAGEPADRAPTTRGADAADTLAAFLAALHQPAPENAPASRHNRGGPLAGIGEGFAHLLKEATDRGLVSDPDAVREVWDDALAAPRWTGPALWLHGDLHPANLLTRDGNFCGVVDFGDMCRPEGRERSCRPATASPWVNLSRLRRVTLAASLSPVARVRPSLFMPGRQARHAEGAVHADLYRGLGAARPQL
jgi:aminoglycoside phosphotransferase (APT) family kinase protein